MNFMYYFAATCDKSGGFFGLPTWYKYLNKTEDALGNCAFKLDNTSDYWLIAAAGIEILLRIAALVAVGFVITGGVKFITSQGEPDKAAGARKTAINALVGLAIAVVAAGLVSYIAGKF